jgi:hypothetical protein
MLLKQRIIFARKPQSLCSFLIIIYVECRVLGALCSCWASLGRRRAQRTGGAPRRMPRSGVWWSQLSEMRSAHDSAWQLIKESAGCCCCHNSVLSTFVSIDAVVCR